MAVYDNNQFVNSAIEKNQEPKAFYLRDFITHGSAIRIKLPYKDQRILEQYIWLEYHRLMHNTGKINYPAWWERDCKDGGTAGIYAYYQVGKDSWEASSAGTLRNPGYTYHLVPISAKGKWVMDLTGDQEANCVCGLRPVEE